MILKDIFVSFHDILKNRFNKLLPSLTLKNDFFSHIPNVISYQI